MQTRAAPPGEPTKPPVFLDDVILFWKRLSAQLAFLAVFYMLGWLRLRMVTVALVASIPLAVHYISNHYPQYMQYIHLLRKQKLSREEKNVRRMRPRDLPRWVRFPSEENASWLNVIVHRLWPLINQYSSDLARNQIEPILHQKPPTWLRPIQLEKFTLGSNPPKIGSLRVYDETCTKREEIVMDFEVFYCGNCDIQVTCKTIPMAQVNNLQFYGHLRLIISPLINIVPLMEKVSVHFIRSPEVLYRTHGILNITEFPFLDTLIHSFLDYQIAQRMLYPNMVSYQIAKLEEAQRQKVQLACPVASGVLRIVLRGGRNLMNKDTFGKSDPYCLIVVGTESFRSKVVVDDLNPVWDESFEVVVYNPAGLSVDVHVLDEDIGKDEDLGNFSVAVEDVNRDGLLDRWFKLENAKRGEIRLQFQFCELRALGDRETPHTLDEMSKRDVQKLDPAQKLPLNRCYVSVFVDCAKKLPRNHPTDSTAYPSPHVRLSVAGSRDQKTRTVSDSCNPVWEQAFDFLANPIPGAMIKAEVIDDEASRKISRQTFMRHSSRKSQKVLGECRIRLSSVIEAPKMTVQMPFLLEQSVESQIVLRVQVLFVVEVKPTLPKVNDLQLSSDLPATSSLRVTEPNASGLTRKYNTIADVRGSFRTQRASRILLAIQFSPRHHQLHVEIQKAQNLPVESSDINPFVKICLKPDIGGKKKTETLKADRNPVWNKKFTFQCSLSELSSRNLQLVIKSDEGIFRKDRKLGFVSVPLYTLNLRTKIVAWFPIMAEKTPTQMITEI